MGGAKNCPETPRQKMIGMMYLVLTAMLALNVSSEVLQGFALVDRSLRTTIESTEVRTQNLYDSFKLDSELNPEKVKEWLDKALDLKEQSDSMYNYIQNFKFQMVKLADKDDADPNTVDIKAKENLDVTGQYALVQGHGAELKQKLEDYRQYLIDLTGTDVAKRKAIENVFDVESSSPGKTWEQGMFEMMPLSAAVTLLTKYQSDIRAAEVDMIQYLRSQTDASDFRVNKIQALIVPNSSYVMKGSKYSAQIVLSAVDSTARPRIYIDGQLIDEDGLYERAATSTGTFKYSGMIRLPIPGAKDSTETNDWPFEGEYVVGEPSATISNEDLNVVYRGIDNKFSISVPGVVADDMEVRAAGATVKKVSGGRYIINPTQDEDINIIVSAKMDGKSVQMGSMKYRVKYIPDPKSFAQYRDAGGVVRQIQEGRLTKDILRSNDFAIVASYGEDELIQANFEVTSFTMTTVYGSVDAQGSKLTRRQLDDINRLERNDVITFKNIKAKGPDGKIRSLSLLQVDV